MVFKETSKFETFKGVHEEGSEEEMRDGSSFDSNDPSIANEMTCSVDFPTDSERQSEIVEVKYQEMPSESQGEVVVIGESEVQHL